MSVLGKLTSFVGGSLFREIKEAVVTYFPPSMTEQEKLEYQMNLNRVLFEQELKTNEILNESAAQLDRRIAEQEGTASDLKAVPFFGTVVLFLRGVQRPLWGFSTLWMDAKWFFGEYTFNEQQQTALIVINVLVLGFLFGERTIKNLAPLITQVFGSKGK